MPSSHLQDAQIGLALDVDVFSQFFAEAHRTDESLQQVSVSVAEGLDLTLNVDSIAFFLDHDTTETLLQLELSTVDASQTIVIQVILRPVLRPVGDAAPVVALEYGGVHHIDMGDGPLTDVIDADSLEERVDALFEDTEAEGSVGERIAGVRLDLLSGLIEGLEAIHFPDEGSRPDRSDWEPGLALLPADGPDTADAMMIAVALPDESAETSMTHSLLRVRTGFGLMFSRILLQELFDRGAEEEVGEERCGSTMQSLTLTLEDDHIQIEGMVEKSTIDVPFSGPVFPFLYRGATQMSVDASEVDAEEPDGLSDFLKFLAVLVGVILPTIGAVLLGPLGLIGGVIADVWAVRGIWGAAEQLDRADELVQGGLGGALGAALSQLASDLRYQGEVETITIDSTPNELRMLDGDFFFDALVFVSPIEETIVNGWFSRTHGRFVFHQLEGGQKFRTWELARLVRAGKIATPGFHAVAHPNGRLYMRADPDNEEANNLQEMFRTNPPDEPFLVSEEEGDGGC